MRRAVWALLALAGASAGAGSARAGELLALRDQLAEEYAGPGWTNYDLTDPAEVARARAAALQAPEDVPALHRALRRAGDPAAAALLAMIGDRRALPQIERWFLRGDFFYGWESCVPSYIDAANWPHHMIYGDAIRLLTGEGPAALIRPTQRQIDQMEREDRTYALSIFAPERALAHFAAQFRVGDRPFAVGAVLVLLPMGLSRSEAEELLGAADAAPDAHTLRWSLGEELCGPRALDLRFTQGRLTEAAMVYLDVEEPPGTTLERAPPAAPGSAPGSVPAGSAP